MSYSALFRSGIGWSLLIVSLLCPSLAQAQGTPTLTGTVVDASDGAPLIGANVVLRDPGSAEIEKGTSTDVDGNFELTDIPPGEYVAEIRFIGYKQRQITLTLEAGESRDLDVELQLESESLETVVVSASRQREKILDAPASISVLQPERIRREITTSSVEALRSAPGVDMAQTGVDRREVALRGFNEAYASSIHVLTDYREASVPSLGVNAYSAMPSIPIDLNRVEVVRGPGSALYGPGVDSGVIHFFTKDPFQSPGTSVSVSGGSRTYLNTQLRQAGVIGDDLGYKVTAQFSRANEWQLNPNNPQDSTEIERYRVYESRSAVRDGQNVSGIDRDNDGNPEAFQLRREDLYRKYNVNGMFKYRLGDETSLTLNGGYTTLTGTFQSGVGTLQTNGFGYSYAQLRFRTGNFFVQAYRNQNHSENDTYVYGTGRRQSDKGLQWNGQAQYSFALANLSTEIVTGADLNFTRPRTNGKVLGRNEGSDAINEYGGYVQTTTDLADPLTLTLAGRADYNNVVEELQLSPRAALVYSVTPNHSVRTSYNQSFSSPGVNSLFLDVPSQQRTLGNGKSLVFQGLGAADGFTFNDFRENQTVRFSLPVDGFFKQDFSINALPILPMYATVAGQTLTESGEFTSPVSQQLAGDEGLNTQQISILAQLFGYMAGNSTQFFNPANSNNRTGATQLGIPDGSGGFRPVDGPVDVNPLKQTTTQTFEFGYKGTFADRVRLSVDGYYEQKEDFVGPLRIESPLAYLQGQALAGDIGGRLGQIFSEALDGDMEGDGTVASLVQQLGLPPQEVAGILGGLVGGSLQNTPAAVVQPDDRQVLPGGGNGDQVGAFLTYRNFGQVQYWGLDASIEADLSETLSAFGNVSYVSDDFFDNEELDESDTSLSLALNAPSFKVKGGFDYGLPAGFSVGTTVHYVDGFPVRTGPYVGNVESYTLLDVRAGYNIPAVPGLNLTLTGKNVLDNRHREFVGAPPLGRMLMARLTYQLP